MSIFSKNALEYYEMGYKPFPTHPTDLKRPLTTARNAGYDFHKILSDVPLRSNIGIGVGHQYGIVAIDIDTPDDYMGSDLEAQIRAILPTSPLHRVGKLGRSLYFFKSEEWADKYEKLKDPNGTNWVEFLTGGRFVIVPPSDHPSGRKYEWTEDNLLDYELEDLPVLPKDIYKKFGEVENLINNNILQLVTNKEKSGGRNNTLTALAYRLAERFLSGEYTKEQSIKELIERDQKHEIPWFDDPTEKKIETPCRMLGRAIKKREEAGPVEPFFQINIVEDKPPVIFLDKEPEKLLKYKKCPGILGEIEDHIFINSPRRRKSFSFASAIATFGTICGNEFVFEGVHTNTYIMLITKSTAGKDAPLNEPLDFFESCGLDEIVGISPRTPKSILKANEVKKVRLDRIDEVHKVFMEMNRVGAVGSSIGDVYAELSEKVGKQYRGDNVGTEITDTNPLGIRGACFSPCVSLITATTYSGFKRSFTQEMVDMGFGGRFLYFDEAQFNKVDRAYKGRTKTNEELKNKIMAIRRKKKDKTLNIEKCKINDNDYNPIEILISEKATTKLAEIRDYIDKIEEKEFYDESSKISPITSRSYMTLIRFAMLYAVSNWGNSEKPIITENAIKWAHHNFLVQLQNVKRFFDFNLSKNKIEQDKQAIAVIIEKAGHNGIAKAIITRQTQKLSSKERDASIKDLLDAEIIFCKDIGEGKSKKKVFFHSNSVMTR
jgi:hypothetical protein